VNNFNKSILKITTCSILLLTLAACGAADKDEIREGYKPPNFKEEAVFIEKFDENRIDVIAEDVKKMYTIPTSLKEIVNGMKKHDIITIEYTLDNELKRNVVGIEVLTGEKKSKDTNKDNESENSNEKDKVSVKVYAGGEWIEKSSNKNSSHTDYSINVLPNYTYNEGKIMMKDNNNYHITFKEIDLNAEIKPERWSAADELKKIGSLKELKGEKIYDPRFRKSEFVFHAKGKKLAKNIFVHKNGDHLMKYTMVYPVNDNNRIIESELWGMLSSIEFKKANR
jgi:hypothetical protein